tara:strand:+ start:310 stop:1623 length:1314 start_codon:yes stop_codon:yes gene_type:complete
MALLIYLERNNARIKYVFDHIFQHILGLDIVFTSDKTSFVNSKGPKINYSKTAFSNELFFYSSDFLSKQTLNREDLLIDSYNDIKIFFLCNHSALPFDPFAASFYMLSRYEEYLSQDRDKFGRFRVEDSMAFKNNFLTKPVVDHWIIFIKEKLLERFPEISIKEHKFQFINTIDIDNAYAYLEKGFFRSLAACLRDIFQFNLKMLTERIRVLFFKNKDPYDTYDKLLRIHNKYNLKTIFFFLLGNYGMYDRNINFSNVKFKNKIKEISNDCDIGIHTSMGSIINREQAMVEIKRLESIINQKVILNRQHFLCLNIPYNYQNFIKHGIKHDYSMGFPTHPGFRAGTSFPFYFFDMEKNSQTNLLIHPFSIMDVSLNYYLQLNPIDALILIKKIIRRIKQVNGSFISIWHNESLNYKNQWTGWDCVYEDMIRFAINEKN